MAHYAHQTRGFVYCLDTEIQPRSPVEPCWRGGMRAFHDVYEQDKLSIMSCSSITSKIQDSDIGVVTWHCGVIGFVIYIQRHPSPLTSRKHQQELSYNQCIGRQTRSFSYIAYFMGTISTVTVPMPRDVHRSDLQTAG